MKVVRYISNVLALLLISHSSFAQPWQRNTFPGPGYQDHDYPAGLGWDHVQNITDLSVSFADPKLRAFVENQWGSVITEDGINFKPLRMPHIGTPGCSPMSIEFSRYDPSTIYLLLAHYSWRSISPQASPAGLWKSADRGKSWVHLYKMPAGAYELSGNNSNGTLIMEDPCPLRSNHLYFGTTSHGLVRSIDAGLNWSTIGSEFSNRRIKTLAAGTYGNNQTVIYAIAEKKMPLHIKGEKVPVSFWSSPSNYTARWNFETNLNDASVNGNHLTGSIASWNESAAVNSHSANLNGTNPLAIGNMSYASKPSKFTISAWVRTVESSNQVIASFDRNEYWELGIRGGAPVFSVLSSAGKIDEVIGTRIDDGDWHYIAGVFNAGLLQLYVDGDRIASFNTGKTTFGSGNKRFGFIGVGSQSAVFGDAKTVSGTGFNGTLDDIRIYNTRAFSKEDVFSTYLDTNFKNPVVQGQLWRIKINSSGAVEEIKRLHAPAEDFFQVEINPVDPSRGWFIRKGYPNGYPYGGRELLRFSNFGETLSNSNVQLGSGSNCFRDIGINPGNANHLYLEIGGELRGAIRYSKDGGVSWLGTNRKVGDAIPSFQSWTAHDYRMYKKGFLPYEKFETIGQRVSFVPGVPNELLYVLPNKGGLMRSLDFGATFASYATGGPLKEIGQIAVAPSDPQRWSISLGEQGFNVTKNDGKLWFGATHEDSGLEHLPAMAEQAGDGWTAARTGGGMAYNPINPEIMIGIFARQGYIVRSNDGGLNWSYTGIRTPGLGPMEVYWKSANPNRVYAGMMKSNDAGENWTNIGKVVLSVCESNPDIIVGVNDYYVDVDKGSLGMYISINGGNTWVNLPDPPAEAVPGKAGTNWEVTGLRRKWNSAADALIAIDPQSKYDPTINSANRIRILMAGRSGIYEYNALDQNGGGSESDWQIRKTGLENSPHYMQIEPVPWMGFVLFDPRPGFENVVYAAKQNDDATLELWAGEDNKNHAYPGGANFEPFYMSQDGGITWSKMHGQDFPDAPESAMIESMTVDSNGRLMAATTEGIYLISVSSVTTSASYKESKDSGMGQPIIYPNPVNDFLIVNVSQPGIFEAEIVNTSGITVRSLILNSSEIDVSDLASGMYLIRIKGNQEIFTKKFIKR